MQCYDLIHKLIMQIECFIYIRRLQRVSLSGEAVPERQRILTIEQSKLLYTPQNKIDKYINKRKTLELIRLIFNLIKYYLLLFPQHLRH